MCTEILHWRQLMAVNEALYMVAYCVFLAGAAKSFRENASTASLRIMTAAIVLDIAVSMLPMAGISFLKSDVTVFNAAIIAGIILGFIVWIFFGAAVVMRKRGRIELFQRLILLVEILWFIDFIIFLYGVYAFT